MAGTRGRSGGAGSSAASSGARGEAPKIAVVDEDPARVREISDLLEQAGYAPHAFTSPRSASHIAVAIGFDAMLIEHGIREMSLPELADGLEHRLGARAPQVVVLTRQLHEMPIPERSRYVAVLPRPIEVDRLLASIESAVARHARATVLDARPTRDDRDPQRARFLV